jgi:hypothetical protein
LSDQGEVSAVETTNVFEKFLGVSASIDYPLSLLGLTADNCNETAIIGALQRQLSRVGSHADAMTPEADEVRLALHAAAARLLDPSTRRQIVQGNQATAAPGAGPEARPFEAAVLVTLAEMGGWNRHSMHRISLLARAFGQPPDQLPEIIRRLMSHPQADVESSIKAPSSSLPAPTSAQWTTSAPATPPTQTEIWSDPFAPAPEEIDPARGVIKALLMFGGTALVGIIAIIIFEVILTSSPKPPAAAPPSPTQPSPIAENTPDPDHQLFPVRPKEAPRTQPAVPLNRVGDWNDQLRAMSSCVTALEADAPAAEEQFEAVFAEMGRKWAEAPQDGIVAAVDRIVEFIYHADHADLAGKAIGVIVDGASPLSATTPMTPEQVLRSAWSAGVMARLTREKDFPAAVRHRVQEALAQAFPGASGPSDQTFRAGAVAALSLMPTHLIAVSKKDESSEPGAQIKQHQQAWKSWLGALSAIDGKQSPLFTRSVLVALDSLLTTAPEPAQDQTIFEAVALLTVALPWRKEDESRRWLLRWFDSPGVTAGDLYAVTSTLATQSGAEGVDSSMVLSTGASDSQRADLRDRYASVWGLTSGESRDVLVQKWSKAANEALDGTVGTELLDPLEHAAWLARLNQAASLLWSGDTGAVPDLLEAYHRPNQPAQPTTSALVHVIPGQRNADWLVKYLAAGHNIPVRRELLAQMTRAPDPAEADILVQEACRGMPVQIRTDARNIVLANKGNAAVINSMLEFAPMVPVTIENADLIEQVSLATLPRLRDPGWRVAVRRALVERLTQVLAGEGDLAQVDALCDVLSLAYTDVPAKTEGPPSPPLPGMPAHRQDVPLEMTAAAQRSKWQREAELLVASGREPLNLAQIESRRSARLRLASGRIQEFAAEQVNANELMAYVVVAEQPGKGEAAAAVLNDLASERTKARHIFNQLDSAEKARLRLWMLRFGEQRT